MDGTFLKGPIGGQLLVAMALDGNCGVFPLAFAIVEKENKYTWSFFLHHLHTMIGDPQQSHMTFMTDRQKVIKPFLFLHSIEPIFVQLAYICSL